MDDHYATLMLARHCVLFAVLIISVYTDLARGKIYNWCTLPGIFVGLLLNYVLGGLWDKSLGSANLGGSLIAALVVLVIFIWPYLKGGIAAGDVKLMVAAAAIGGLQRLFIFYALFCTALLGAVMAGGVLLWRRRLWAGIKETVWFTLSTRRISEEKGLGEGNPQRITVPYGLAISIGSILAWFIVERPI